MKSIFILVVVLLGGCATPSPNAGPTGAGAGTVGDSGGYCDTACVRGLICSNHTCIKPY